MKKIVWQNFFTVCVSYKNVQLSLTEILYVFIHMALHGTTISGILVTCQIALGTFAICFLYFFKIEGDKIRRHEVNDYTTCYHVETACLKDHSVRL